MQIAKLNMVVVLCIAVLATLIGCADENQVRMDEEAIAKLKDEVLFRMNVRIYLTTGCKDALHEAAHGRAYCDFYGDANQAFDIFEESEETLPLILRMLRLQAELRIHERECAEAAELAEFRMKLRRQKCADALASQ